MLLTKTTMRLAMVVGGILLMLALLPSQTRLFAQAGCGDEMGPPSPGTVCPDGTIPLPDPSLPLGCPGSSQQGPAGPSYSVSCPARPGRAECVFLASTGNCTDSSGKVVYPVTASNPIDEPDVEINDCNGPNIKAGLDESDPNHCGILDYLVVFINVLSGLVGIAVAVSIIVAGIQYSSAGSDPQKISAAKSRIRNSILALMFFLFMYALLNYLVPGGVLR